MEKSGDMYSLRVPGFPKQINEKGYRVTYRPTDDLEKLKKRIEEITKRKHYGAVEIITDTTSQLNIYRGHIVRLQNRDFFILGDVLEPRFGLDDQPKYWVKKTIDMADGSIRLLKLVFFEEFIAHVGPIRIRCFRSPSKESSVLDMVRGDVRFMQGMTLTDAVQNEVRVIDFIHGKGFYDHMFDLRIDHEAYFHTLLPGILEKLIPAMEAIQTLHDMDTCHGDIRNDHIIMDRDTGLYRWIDFDLTQHYPDYDVWSLGNILHFAIGKGMVSFKAVQKSDGFSNQVKHSLNSADAAAFYRYRIMNLRKVYGYIPKKLNDIMMHFTISTEIFYESVQQIIDDLRDAMADLPRPGMNESS